MKWLETISILAMLSLAACASTGHDEVALASGATLCEEPRPQVCTMDYRPVCASLRDGATKTYSNGCSACSDAEVISWVENPCGD